MNYSFADKICLNLDRVLRTVLGNPPTSDRIYPAKNSNDTPLSDSDRRKIAGLMRVNHAGEVCAQALYQGQALTARTPQLRTELHAAAIEENDHLSWCHTRLKELDSHRSYLNVLWYVGSLSMGCTAGLFGDKWSLGFLAETEAQVTRHLQQHLDTLPAEDERTKAILTQMQIDEAAHQAHAVALGAAELPHFIKTLMRITSKCMTKIAYYL